ncbi:MAG: Undecaprenyl-phosphate 4-deoxy-4-formamido-L-arabinose transferase [Fimbriimonadaceae bacterium]|nr:Undecaprenyl-phosphate 4-deoxy-4-formamido-L-arabinose transferase [Fimbriimonadaceae bacterium]
MIVPAYNEADRIVPSLTRMVEYFSGAPYSWTITVVSDGSTDDTAKLVAAFSDEEPRVSLIEYQPNRGKGFAVRTGMLQAPGAWKLLSDADLATPIEEVEKLFAAVEQDNPVAIGSRPLRESSLEIRQPFYREWLGRSFNFAVQSLGIRGIHDTQCGFKLFKGEIAEEIFQRVKLDGFGYDFEALMIARDLGYPIAEIPIRWRHQEGSKVRVVRDGLRMLRDLVRLRLWGKNKRLEPRAD